MKYNIGDNIIVNGGMATIVDFVGKDYKVLVDRTLDYEILKESQIKMVKDNKDIPSEKKIKEQKIIQYTKQIDNRHKKLVKEGVEVNDLEYLIDPFVSVDQYTSKIKDDNITIAMFCTEKMAAQDLIDFLEKMYFIEIVDIELSESMTNDDKYIVYIEVERNPQFPELLMDIVDSVNFVINKKLEDWTFQSFGMEAKQPLTLDNIKNNIRLVDIEEEKSKKKEIKKETVEYSKNHITRKYLDEGYVSEQEFNDYIKNCELLNENALDKEILEYNIPNTEIITADDKVFIVGDKIKMLGVE